MNTVKLYHFLPWQKGKQTSFACEKVRCRQRRLHSVLLTVAFRTFATHAEASAARARDYANERIAFNNSFLSLLYLRIVYKRSQYRSLFHVYRLVTLPFIPEPNAWYIRRRLHWKEETQKKKKRWAAWGVRLWLGKYLFCSIKLRIVCARQWFILVYTSTANVGWSKLNYNDFPTLSLIYFCETLTFPIYLNCWNGPDGSVGGTSGSR